MIRVRWISLDVDSRRTRFEEQRGNYPILQVEVDYQTPGKRSQTSQTFIIRVPVLPDSLPYFKFACSILSPRERVPPLYLTWWHNLETVWNYVRRGNHLNATANWR